MKYLIIVALVLVVYALWRLGRERQRQDAASPRKPAVPPRLEMVRCDVCGMHLPEPEAVRSDSAYYCSAEHLRQAERS